MQKGKDNKRYVDLWFKLYLV